MHKEISCYKCGTKIPLNYKNMSAIIECPHCKKKMVYDVTTYKRLKIIRYFVVLLIGLMLIIGMNQFDKGNYALLIILISFSISLAFVADRVCLWLCNLIFGLQYEEYIKKGK